MEPVELYRLVADTLDRSAELADAHAMRDRRPGHADPVELANAKRARAAANRARELASQFATRPAEPGSPEAPGGPSSAV